MKIVYVVHEFPPDSVGGTGVATFQVAKEMLARGHKLWVLTPQLWVRDDLPSIGFLDEKVDGLSVRKLVFNPELAPNPILYEYYNPVLFVYAKDFLREISPDIIHIYHLLHLSSSIIDAAKELRIPIVLTLTDFLFFCPKCALLKFDGALCEANLSWEDCIRCLREENSLYDKIIRTFGEKVMKFYVEQAMSDNKFNFGQINNRQIFSLLIAAASRLPFLKNQLAKVNQIVCTSSFLSKIYLRRGYIPDGFRVVTHGTMYPPKLPSTNNPIPNITFAYFGGGNKHKGVHVLLQAFRQIESTKVNLKLYGIFPNTEYVNELRRIAQGDERIDFMGNYERAELTKVLAGIDVLVMPSVSYEAYGLAILEAFANKVPVIATDIGGIPEIVRDGHNGLLFERGNVLDLKQKMERVMNEPGLIQKFRENIPQVKSVNEECDELLGIYEELRKRGQSHFSLL